MDVALQFILSEDYFIGIIFKNLFMFQSFASSSGPRSNIERCKQYRNRQRRNKKEGEHDLRKLDAKLDFQTVKAKELGTQDEGGCS